jgi:hypothetical protein|tara:strand:+ start:13738 stop:14511 length:774 start_codon:yes stop_codon:yes gene_type:complete
MKLSHWYGRLGNNIQQTAIGLMCAQAYQTKFIQPLEHDIIGRWEQPFGVKPSGVQGKFFYYNGPFHEVPIDAGKVYTEMRAFCKEYVRPYLCLPRVDVDPDTLVIHIRSGDVFDQRVDNPGQYVPNPYCFYSTLLESFDRAIVVTEPDQFNPIVEELKWDPKVTVQSKSVAEDFATLMAAKHVATSGVGTFAMAAVLCSENITDLYCTNICIEEHLNYKMLYNTDVTINMMVLQDYIKTGEWANTDEQREFLFSYKV